jgi:hypothetical protein
MTLARIVALLALLVSSLISYMLARSLLDLSGTIATIRGHEPEPYEVGESTFGD